MRKVILLVVVLASARVRAGDVPSVKLGGVLFADYTWVQSPTAVDSDGNRIHPSSFNVTRAYINVTGNIFRNVAFRITPDVARESGSGSSLNGSLTFRLKYAYGQYDLDDVTTKGSWIRFGLQQTPWLDFAEGVYRYRFQGPAFTDREGFQTAGDFGASAHWNFPGNYGDIHGGFYNGEGYSHAEANDQKAFQIRSSFRPLPAAATWKGLRLTGFIDQDHATRSAKRQRLIAAVTFEHDRFNAGIETLRATDRRVKSEGYSIFVTPKLPHNFEILLRHDELKPDRSADTRRRRNIAGVAYWVPQRTGVTSAFMVDYDSLQQTGFDPRRPRDTRYGLKMLMNF